MWVEDDQGTSPDKVVMKNKIHPLRGSWIDMHDQPVCFNARRFHKAEPHEGHMWAIAAYTPTAFKRCSNENREELASLGFPVPRRDDDAATTTTRRRRPASRAVRIRVRMPVRMLVRIEVETGP